MNDDIEKKDEIVSHYTTTAAFAELLKPDAYFYGTHCDFLNDPEEKVYAESLFDQFIKNNTLWKTHSKKINRKFTLFIMSFSSKKDDINQWRAYTSQDEGGFSIQFKKSAIENPEWYSRYPQESTWIYGFKQRIHIGWGVIDSVRYGEDEAKELFDLYIERANENRAADFNFSKETDVICQYWISYYYALFSGLVKNINYKDESEYRVVFVTTDKSRIEMIGEKPRRKLFSIDHKKMIAGITVSPHGDKAKNKRLAEVLCENVGLNPEIVHESNVPYKGK